MISLKESILSKRTPENKNKSRRSLVFDMLWDLVETNHTQKLSVRQEIEVKTKNDLKKIFSSTILGELKFEDGDKLTLSKELIEDLFLGFNSRDKSRVDTNINIIKDYLKQYNIRFGETKDDKSFGIYIMKPKG